MPIPGEHKTVQARILEYAEAIGWTVVFREEGVRQEAGPAGDLTIRFLGTAIVTTEAYNVVISGH